MSLAPLATGAPALPLEGLSDRQRAAFAEGETLFMTRWAPAPAEDGRRDGLGPFFHASSCVECHPGGGRGLSPDAGEPGLGPVFRVGTADDGMLDEYGVQLSPRAVPGVTPEAVVTVAWSEERGSFHDGTPWLRRVPAYAVSAWNYGPAPDGVKLSARLAPALHGMGLLEAVSDETMAALADPEDRDGDGVSGRLNREESWEGYAADQEVAGRFGWKAWMPSVMRQVCGALGEDMGLTNVFQPHDTTPAQSDQLGEYPRGGHGDLFEAGGRIPERLADFVRFLGPPPVAESAGPGAVPGRALFTQAGCAACHLSELKTGSVPDAAALSHQTIHPFTDLLLHDMGAGLADGRPEALASGREWRTAPLWGLGNAVNHKGEGRLLHDGRARSLQEAILWHDGEGARSRDAFLTLPAADRAALLTFLKSL